MFSDSAQVADVIVGKFAYIADVSHKIKILIKHIPNFLAVFNR